MYSSSPYSGWGRGALELWSCIAIYWGEARVIYLTASSGGFLFNRNVIKIVNDFYSGVFHSAYVDCVSSTA